MAGNWTVTLGSAVTGGTVSGTVVGLFDAVVIGAGAVLTYGSGGTAATFYLQTSQDGTDWWDVAAIGFGTATLSKYVVLGQPSAGTAPFSTTDATLGANTVGTVPVGDMARLRYTTTGTYSASTVNIYLVAKR